MKRLDLTNQRFGRLTALSKIGRRQHGRSRIYWECLCDCGEHCTIETNSLTSDRTRSCGCLQRELVKERCLVHGGTVNGKHSPEYESWQKAKSRCYKPSDPKFPLYGARGITMCARWQASFAAFLEDMGWRPSPKHSLDRYPDNNGNYEPGNCRWATAKKQSNNRRSNVIVTVDGEKYTLKQFAEMNAVNYKSLHSLVRYQRLEPAQAIKQLRS